MAGEFSNQGAIHALNAVTHRLTVTAAPGYLALLTAAPTDTTTLATMTEYAATGYERQVIDWDAPILNGSSQYECRNTSLVAFGPFTAGTGTTVTHCALVSAQTGTVGEIWAFWTLDTSRTPAVDEVLQFAVAALKLAVD